MPLLKVVMGEVVEEASKAKVVEAFKAEEEEALVEEAVEVFKAAVVDLMEAVVVAAATKFKTETQTAFLRIILL